MTYINDQLIVPVSYQGGKQRLASQIVDHWWPTDARFYDLCCGSGALTIEMVNRGLSVDDIVMVDAGPWGLFWSEIGAGTFDFDVLCSYIKAIPSDPSLIREFLKELSECPASTDTSEVFILLQAGSFGGKAIWIKDDAWCNTSFRSYWEPTTTSSRRSHVNPMMPMPETIKRRIWTVMQRCHQVLGMHADVMETDIEYGSLVYLDPPYKGTTAYGHKFDVEVLFDKLRQTSTCFVSEGRQIGEHGICLNTGRAKGGISGNRNHANEEWLSWSRLGEA